MPFPPEVAHGQVTRAHVQVYVRNPGVVTAKLQRDRPRERNRDIAALFEGEDASLPLRMLTAVPTATNFEESVDLLAGRRELSIVSSHRPLYTKRGRGERALRRGEFLGDDVHLSLAVILACDPGCRVDRSNRVTLAGGERSAAKIKGNGRSRDRTRNPTGRAQLAVKRGIDLLQPRRVEREVEPVAGLTEGPGHLKRIAGHAQSHADVAYARWLCHEMPIARQRQPTQTAAWVDVEAHVG